MNCTSCGSPLDPNDRFCTGCGAQVQAGAIATPTVPASQPTSPAAPPQAALETPPAAPQRAPKNAPSAPSRRRSRPSSLVWVGVLVVLLGATAALGWFAWSRLAYTGEVRSPTPHQVAAEQSRVQQEAEAETESSSTADDEPSRQRENLAPLPAPPAATRPAVAAAKKPSPNPGQRADPTSPPPRVRFEPAATGHKPTESPIEIPQSQSPPTVPPTTVPPNTVLIPEPRPPQSSAAAPTVSVSAAPQRPTRVPRPGTAGPLPPSQAAAPSSSPPSSAPTTISSPTSQQPVIPSKGDLYWTGRLRKNAIVTIEGETASLGAPSGAELPGKPVTLETFSTAVEIVEPPGPENGWKRIKFRCLRNTKRSATVNFQWRLAPI